MNLVHRKPPFDTPRQVAILPHRRVCSLLPLIHSSKTENLTVPPPILAFTIFALPHYKRNFLGASKKSPSKSNRSRKRSPISVCRSRSLGSDSPLAARSERSRKSHSRVCTEFNIITLQGSCAQPPPKNQIHTWRTNPRTSRDDAHQVLRCGECCAVRTVRVSRQCVPHDDRGSPSRGTRGIDSRRREDGLVGHVRIRHRRVASSSFQSSDEGCREEGKEVREMAVRHVARGIGYCLGFVWRDQIECRGGFNPGCCRRLVLLLRV